MKSRGYTLIEMVIYISLLAILVIAVVFVLLGIVRSYDRLNTELELQSNLASSLEAISREIQQSDLVNETSSTFDANPGVLYLDNGGIVSEIELSGGDITLTRDSVLVGSLNTDDIEVTNLTFRYLNGFFSDAIKVEMTIEADGRTVNGYSTVVLRGSIDD